VTVSVLLTPILIAYPNAWIYQITEDGLHRIAHEQTDHYAVTKCFLNDSKRQLEALLR
jgi:predicted ATPase